MPFFSRLFGRSTADAEIERLYVALVKQARREAFYTRLAVPDTLDGRFELIALHVHLAIRALGRGDRSQALFDRFFFDMDRSLREMGVGDLSVGKRVKKMVAAYYGRARAYDAALVADEAEALEDALRRNVYGTASPPPGAAEALSAYFAAADRALTELPRPIACESISVALATVDPASGEDGTPPFRGSASAKPESGVEP